MLRGTKELRIADSVREAGRAVDRCWVVGIYQFCHRSGQALVLLATWRRKRGTGVLRRWSPQAWLGADQERRSAPARQVQVSPERDSGWACRCGTTTFMTLTSLLPAGRVRPRYGAMTAASPSATW